MTINFTSRTSAAFAATMVVSAVLFGLPSSAISADGGQLAQASQPQSAPIATPSAAKPARANPVEARINALHTELKITAAQEPQWSVVAQVMRDNAMAVSALIEDREQKAKTMTAIDDLHAYQAVAEAHETGVKKLTVAFEGVYGVMSDAQKKNADAVFSRRPRPSSPKKE
jgi:periplasmic protein CpxP/Spy